MRELPWGFLSHFQEGEFHPVTNPKAHRPHHLMILKPSKGLDNFRLLSPLIRNGCVASGQYRISSTTQRMSREWCRLCVISRHSEIGHKTAALPLKEELYASTFRQILNRGHYDEAADELLRCVYCNGRRLRGLVLRRNDERALFLA